MGCSPRPSQRVDQHGEHAVVDGGRSSAVAVSETAVTREQNGELLEVSRTS
jgi:hypothetical protein